MRFEAKCDCTIAQNQNLCLKHCFNLLWRTLNESKYFILVFSNCAIFLNTNYYGIFHEFCEKLRFEVNYAKSQNIRSIGLNALSMSVNSLDIFLQYIFEFVFNTAPSALSGVCRQKCHGKGFKSCMIILSSVVVRIGCTEQDIWCLIPVWIPFSFFFLFFWWFVLFVRRKKRNC